MPRGIIFAVVLAFASPSFAQIVYEPVQYQYGTQDKFYYGGSDARTIERANSPRCHLEGEVERVYTDAVPNQNARLFGYTATDARNQAYANYPRYFRKSDVKYLAQPSDIGWVVPAQARVADPNARIIITRHGLPPAITGPRPVFIIPKKALENLDQKPPTKVALLASLFLCI
jgi:hypothetical protein